MYHQNFMATGHHLDFLVALVVACGLWGLERVELTPTWMWFRDFVQKFRDLQ